MSSNIPPLLSICCLGYNHAEFILDNLNSISNITYSNIEVIVVDDGSKDESVKLLNDNINNFIFPIKIIAQENTGNIGKNFNNAIKLAKGKFITFISLDDVFNSKTITEFINIISIDESLAFIASSKAISINALGFVDPEKPGKLRLEDIQNPSIDDLLKLEYSDFGAFYIQGAIFRKDIVDQVNGFDEDMTGDDIILRTKIFLFLRKNSTLNYKIINQPSVFYRLHDTNIHKNSTRQIKIVSEYLGKYWPDTPLPQTFINWSLYSIKYSSFDHANEIINLNSTTRKLLELDVIQKALNKTKPSFFKKFIFNKIRTNDGKNITLLGFINFTYQNLNIFKKLMKKQQPQATIHYLEY